MYISRMSSLLSLASTSKDVLIHTAEMRRNDLRHRCATWSLVPPIC
ncbi:hypothetical protein FOXYSP1_13032 [Fusarium oxysporum f. sp. phaseoli]